MNKPICMHFYVRGLVQGVWFRANAKREADALGITGWVKNLPDGSVEVMACGDATTIAQFHSWLKKGSGRAKVTEVEKEERECAAYPDFQIL